MLTFSCTTLWVMRAAVGVNGAAPKDAALGQTYTLLKCMGDTDGSAGVWEEVYVGKAQQREVYGLQPGTTYSFRVQVCAKRYTSARAARC